MTDAPNAPGLTIRCEVHDSEIVEVEGVLERLNLAVRDGKRVSYDAFQREIVERFQDIGFIAKVAWWTGGTKDGAVIPGMLIPEITLTDRIEAKTFDYDRQVHEVTHDLLGLGEGGVIKSDPLTSRPPEDGHQH
jgi:hypothetical protein